MAGKITNTGSGRITPNDEGHVGGWSASENVASVAIGQYPPGTGALSFSGGERDEESGHYSEWVISESATFTHVPDGGPDLGEYPGNISSVTTQGGTVSGSIASVLNLLNAERLVQTKGTFTEYSGLPNLRSANGTPYQGQFNGLGSMAFDPAGNLYVAERGNGRIIKFDPTGAYLAATAPDGVGAGYGTGDGQFSSTGTDYRIALDSSGRVLVTDPGNNRVQRFTSSLVFDTKFGAAGSLNGQMINPVGIAVDTSDRVYVVDLGNYRVQRFTSGLAYDTKWGTQGDANGQFSIPYAIVLDASGRAYVSDGPSVTYPNVSRVQVFTAAGSFVTSFNIHRISGAYAPFAYDLAIDGSGNIYADEINSNTVSRYTAYPELAYSGTWGSYGTGVGQIQYARGIAIHPDGRIFVSDFGTGRVNTFTPGGQYTQPLSAYYQDYVDSCIPGHVIDYQAANDPEVIYPGWRGNVWNKLNDLSQANAQEIAMVDGAITIRDIGEREVDPDFFISPPSLTVDAQGLSRALDIEHQNITYGDGVIMYDARTDNNRIFQIAVGKKETFTVATNSYPVLVNTPTPVFTLPVGPGQYYVTGSDNLPVQPAQWLAYGGSVEAAIGANPNEIDITVTGPATEIPGVPAPYYLSASDGSNNYATITISGAGVKINPRTLRLYTGADHALVTEEVGSTISNIFIDSEADAYDRGVWASTLACGPNVALNGEVDLAACEGFGLTSGSVIPWADSRYRIETVNINNARAQITARRYVTSGDEVDAWTSLTPITNLSQNPSIEANTTGFAAGSGLAAIARNNAWASSGSWSLRLSANSNSSAYAGVGSTASPVIPWGMVAGRTYTVSADVHSVFPGGGAWLADAGRIEVWYTTGGSGGRLAFTDPLPTFAVDARQSVTFTIPAGATGLRIDFWATGVGSNWFAYWDSILVTEGEFNYQFFDGNTPGATWAGTVNNSASSKAPNSAGDYARFWNGEPAKNATIRPLRTPDNG